jgi:hypothetical protein
MAHCCPPPRLTVCVNTLYKKRCKKCVKSDFTNLKTALKRRHAGLSNELCELILTSTAQDTSCQREAIFLPLPKDFCSILSSPKAPGRCVSLQLPLHPPKGLLSQSQIWGYQVGLLLTLCMPCKVAWTAWQGVNERGLHRAP